MVKIAIEWPEVTEAVSYGEPSLKVRKRLLTRTRLTDHSIVLMDVSFDERELLIEASPETYFSEEHYRNYDIVLARLDKITPQEVRTFLERRWRNSASKRAISAFDRGTA